MLACVGQERLRLSLPGHLDKRGDGVGDVVDIGLTADVHQGIFLLISKI